MSGRDHLAGQGSGANEVYPPGERYQPSARINWRAVIILVAISQAFNALGRAVGLDAVWRQYVPVWVICPFFVALGLFYILRPAPDEDRAPAIVGGSFLVLLGVLLSLSFLL